MQGDVLRWSNANTSAGTCVNTGCTPTKTMVGSALVAYLSGRAKEFGVRATVSDTKMERIRQRKNDIMLQGWKIHEVRPE